MPSGTKLSSNKNAQSNLTLTPDNLDYIYIFHRQERNNVQSSLKQPQKSYQKGNQQL